MRPLKQILDELVEAGRTVTAAADPDRDPGTGAHAVDAIARELELLPPDEQEAVRVHVGAPVGSNGRDVALALRDRVG